MNPAKKVLVVLALVGAVAVASLVWNALAHLDVLAHALGSLAQVVML